MARTYGTKRWIALTRVLDDGRLEIDNNIAERLLRGIAVGRRHRLFAASRVGGERAAAICTVIETCKMNGVDLQAYIADVIAKIANDWPAALGRTHAVELVAHDRRPSHSGGLIHHSDRGSQCVSIKYTERLAEADTEPWVGSVGDSYDNASAETINGLYKPEVIHRQGPWRSFEAVEYATLEWVDWFDHRRLLERIGNIPPAEAEEQYYAMIEQWPMAASLKPNSPRQTRRGSRYREIRRGVCCETSTIEIRIQSTNTSARRI